MRNTRKLKRIEEQMDRASTYEQWSSAAREHDELSGQARWRQVDQTSQYDYAQIRLRLDKLRRWISGRAHMRSDEQMYARTVVSSDARARGRTRTA